MEEWKPIPGLEGKYSASSLGQIRGPRGKNLRLQTDRGGYLFFEASLSGSTRRFVLAHCAVALTFNGPCPDGLQVSHKDTDKTNNRPDNLKYRTLAECVRVSFQNGSRDATKPIGEKHGMAKLSLEDVLIIRDSYRNSDASITELGRRFRVTKQCIWGIVNRKSWAHVA